MKTEKLNLEEDRAKDNINNILKKDKNGKIGNPIMIILLPLIAMLVSVLPSIISENTDINTAKSGIVTLILTTVISFYIRLNSDILLVRKWSKSIIVLSYLGSICLLLFVPSPEIFSFWMIGGFVVSMLLDNRLGLLIYFNLSFILGITLSLRLETLIQILIIGVLMSLLSAALKQISTIIYAAIIILSTNITLSFVINNFIFEIDSNFNYLNSLFSISAVIVTAFFICIFYEKSIEEAEEREIVSADSAPTPELGAEAVESNVTAASLVTAHDRTAAKASSEDNKSERNISEQSKSEQSISEQIISEQEIKDDSADLATDSVYQKEFRTSYELLCDHNNELLQRLKEFSESIYQHSMLIGDLSYRAAKEIGADELLAKAGGLYHEIGKLKGKNYIEEGLLLADEYSFPKELTAILKEHNIKYDKPNSVEAAIVMLSDNIVSTIEYIEKSEEHKYTNDKIIDNIFQMRMEKGTFDSSDLSLKDFKILKEFYQKEFKK